MPESDLRRICTHPTTPLRVGRFGRALALPWLAPGLSSRAQTALPTVFPFPSRTQANALREKRSSTVMTNSRAKGERVWAPLEKPCTDGDVDLLLLPPDEAASALRVDHRLGIELSGTYLHPSLLQSGEVGDLSCERPRMLSLAPRPAAAETGSDRRRGRCSRRRLPPREEQLQGRNPRGPRDVPVGENGSRLPSRSGAFENWLQMSTSRQPKDPGRSGSTPPPRRS